MRSSDEHIIWAYEDLDYTIRTERNIVTLAPSKASDLDELIGYVLMGLFGLGMCLTALFAGITSSSCQILNLSVAMLMKFNLEMKRFTVAMSIQPSQNLFLIWRLQNNISDSPSNTIVNGKNFDGSTWMPTKNLSSLDMIMVTSTIVGSTYVQQVLTGTGISMRLAITGCTCLLYTSDAADE